MRHEHEELRELLAPYVLDAVAPEEGATVRAHLTECEECRTEVERLEAGSSRLLETIEPEPLPEGFTDRVMAQVSSARPAAPAGAPARRRRVPVHLLAYACLVVALVGLTAGLVDARRDAARAGLVARTMLAEGMDLSGAGGAVARMVPTDEGGVFAASGLDSAPDGRTYQLWLLSDSCGSDSCKPVSAGTFEVEGGLGILETDRSLAEVDAVAVTVEPDGGSEGPTSDPVLAS